MDKQITGVFFTPEKRIKTPGGDVLHGMKKGAKGYVGFGEAYFSFLAYDKIKAWKKHQIMTLNLLVPVGAIRFIAYDDRDDSTTKNNFFELTLSATKQYGRLTIPPLVWLGFKGVGSHNLLLNVASHPHADKEVARCALTDIPFNW